MAGVRASGGGRGHPEGGLPNRVQDLARYGARLRRYFASRAPPEDADDLVQDVFLRLQQSRAREPIVDIERYLFTVAHNILVSQRRRQAARGRGLHQPLDEASEPPNELSPERILVGRQDFARLVRAVGELPPRARVAFRLRHFESLSQIAIAKRMGVSSEAVKALLRRARTGIGLALRHDG